MGAWGIGNFENDDAADFVAEITDGDSLAPIQAHTAYILKLKVDEEYIEAPDACMMLASGEVVALIAGYGASDAPDSLTQWVKQHHFSLKTIPVDKVIEAVRIVFKDSELRELWLEADDDTDDAREWKNVVNDLLMRLQKI